MTYHNFIILFQTLSPRTIGRMVGDLAKLTDPHGDQMFKTATFALGDLKKFWDENQVKEYSKGLNEAL